MCHRPIGIGVQGLADTFILLGMPFDSSEVLFPLLCICNLLPSVHSWYVTSNVFQAQQLNKDIFETIYYHSLKASAELAAKEGPYETYEGSPVSKVLFFKISLF